MVRYHESKKKKIQKTCHNNTYIYIIQELSVAKHKIKEHTHTNKYNDIFHTCRGIIDAVLCSSCLPDIKACIGGLNTKLKKKILGCNVDLD